MPEKAAKKETKTSKKTNVGKMFLMGAGGLVAAIVFAAIAFKILVITPVSPDKICAHAFDLMKKEIKEKTGRDVTVDQIQKVAGITQQSCIDDVTAQQKNKVQGLIRTTKRSKCEIAATTMKVFDECATKTAR
jgi:hypothetical protein